MKAHAIRRIAFCLSGAIVAAGMAGCSSSTASAPEPSIGAVASIDDPAEVTRPIDAYLATPQQAVALAQVQLSVSNRCLADHGISGTYAVTGSGFDAFVRGVIANRALRSDLWGFFSPATAASEGYQRPAGDDAGFVGTEAPPGTPDDVGNACNDKSMAALSGTMWSSFLYPRSLPAGGPEVPTTDSRWVSAVSQWSACMKAKGFALDSPLSATIAAWYREKPASAEQIAAATADVQCKISTNLVGIGVALQAAYDQQYIDAHRAELDAFLAQRDRYLRGGT